MRPNASQKSAPRIDRGAMQGQVKALLDRLGVRLDPERPVRGLSSADQQIVEIAKALSLDARVLIMDEPTAALSGPEVERLFSVVRTLREQARAYCSSRIASTRSSRSPTRSRSCATAPSCTTRRPPA